ncbi:hypothetical protein GCM10022630_08350 [Thermobifida alba]
MDADTSMTCTACRGRGWRWTRLRRGFDRTTMAELRVEPQRQECWDCAGSGRLTVASFGETAA